MGQRGSKSSLEPTKVARVTRYPEGPQKGLWCWYGQWVGHDNKGTCDTLEEALEVVRQRAPDDALIYDKNTR